MPLSVRVDTAAGLAWITGSGVLTLDDLTKLMTELVEDPDFAPGMPQVCDLSGIRDTDLDAEQLRRLVGTVSGMSERLGGSPVAVVAPEAVIYGLSRMYEVLAEPVPVRVRVFRDREEALLWLHSL